ncbi:MAG TPA: Fic family protein [Puia sp.]|jgi:death-on-curing protein|nr:Fic family protein [Puia sp.]
MNKTIPLDLLDFELLLNYAQEKHSNKSEPIPRLSNNTERLESCLNTPFQKFSGKYLYPGKLNKAAILFYLINKNHPLINGNKRMACICLSYFCFINGYFLRIPEDPFYNIAKRIVESDNSKKEEVITVIKRIIKENWEKRSD